MSHNPLLVAIEQLQTVLLARATGEGDDQAEYHRLRAILMANSSIEPLLPRFVHSCRDLGQFWALIKVQYPGYQARREFIWREFRPVFDAIEHGLSSPVEKTATETLSKLDAEHVRRYWAKALERVHGDPAGAITSARTLVESICKLILDAQGIDYEKNQDLNKLYKQAARSLNLGPDQHEPQVFKQILSGCYSVVEGVASLRNSLGDAHGQGASPVQPAARHAILAVNLAGTMATFLLQSFATRHGEHRVIE